MDNKLEKEESIMAIKEVGLWIRCNILNKHNWWWCGVRDLYGNPFWKCDRCNRVKYKSYDAEMVAKKRKEIREVFSKKPTL